MKITLSSPDGIGDFILRLPLMAALRDAGHTLQIFMRRPAADLARHVFPGIDIHVIGADPYHESTRRQGNPFRAEHRLIRTFQPDLYVAALFHLNFFDQVWIEHAAGVPCAGFSSVEDFWASGTTCDPRLLAKRFDPKVTVPAALPEIEKTRKLAEALLARDLPEFTPRLTVGDAELAEARALLASHGLAEGKFWITCVGSRPGLITKDWGEANWTEFFRALPDDPLVFFGNPKESASIDRIRGPLRQPTVNLAAGPSLPVSLALASLSAGYLGRDSGVMHMAAALGRPVLAIFGGGHGKRFFPAASSGVVVTQDWPCRDCDSCCAHEGRHCITEVPQAAMREGWELLPSRPVGLKIIEVPVPPPRLDALAREASRKYARVTQEFYRWKSREARTVNWLDALGQLLRKLARKNYP